MKGTNDAWNMCINQCIVNGWFFRAKLIKGDNFDRYKIINNERALRDVVYRTTERILMQITLHPYQVIQVTSED